MESEKSPYIVYVKSNADGYITAVNSSVFLTDTTGWKEIDSGCGDKYHHAQNHYFPKPALTDGGAYRYKLVDGVPVECTAEEIAQQEEANRPVPGTYGNLEERVSLLESNAKEITKLIKELLAGAA